MVGLISAVEQQIYTKKYVVTPEKIVLTLKQGYIASSASREYKWKEISTRGRVRQSK